jgi:hypothetical protein
VFEDQEARYGYRYFPTIELEIEAMQQLYKSEDSLDLEGVCCKFCLDDRLGDCPLSLDDMMEQEALNSRCGPNPNRVGSIPKPLNYTKLWV